MCVCVCVCVCVCTGEQSLKRLPTPWHDPESVLLLCASKASVEDL